VYDIYAIPAIICKKQALDNFIDKKNYKVSYEKQ